MILFPNAKINLGLCVTDRRADGYHNLRTVMVPVPWCDVLEIVPGRSASTTLTVTGRGVECHMEKNLVIKALRALERRVGDLPPVDIYLEKIIPDGAGLGGGSADATFALKGFNEVLGIGLDDSALEEIAAGVGADCAFFVANRPALCTGIGDKILPIEIPQLQGLSIVIAKPRVAAVSTAEAYAGIVPHMPDESPEAILADDIASWSSRLINDFETSIFTKLPAVEALKQQFYDLGATYASMSGSGAAVYALFATDNMAHDALTHLRECDAFVGHFDNF